MDRGEPSRQFKNQPNLKGTMNEPAEEQNKLAHISDPPGLLERAIASGANIEVIERLMGLQERWQANRAKQAFDGAMAALRTELPPIVKNNTVDFTTARGRTHYKYEDLQDVTEALTPVMAKYGLSFRWRTQPGELVTVTCIVSHREGHSEECALSAPRDESGNKNAIQALGSAITYLQRYTLKAALGVAATRDDDGQSSGARPEPAREGAPSAPSNWRDYPVPFGKNKGAKLGALESKSLSWYIEKYEPKPYNGKISDSDQAFRAALDAAKADLAKPPERGPEMSQAEKDAIMDREIRDAEPADTQD